jgi:periplasmic protein TonB
MKYVFLNLLIVFFIRVSYGQSIFPEKDSLGIYLIVPHKPSYPFGEKALKSYLQTSLIYPQSAIKDSIVGIVKVKMIVRDDGSITDVKVVKSLGHGCDEEALRLIKSMPKWKPAMKDGKAVSVYYIVPVSFSF